MKHNGAFRGLCLPTEAQIQVEFFPVFYIHTLCFYHMSATASDSDTEMEKKEEPEFRCVL